MLSIRKRRLQSGQSLAQQQRPTVTMLDVGGMHDDLEHQAFGVYQQAWPQQLFPLSNKSATKRSLPFEHGAMHPSEWLIFAHLNPATRRVSEHAQHGCPWDDLHDCPAPARLTADVYGMGGCRGY